jgi:hypothetical protein
MNVSFQRAATSWLLPLILLIFAPILLKNAWSKWRRG